MICANPAAQGYARTWRRLKGEIQLPKVIQGVKFRNGVEVTKAPAQSAA
jgi:putative transposase